MNKGGVECRGNGNLLQKKKSTLILVKGDLGGTYNLADYYVNSLT